MEVISWEVGGPEYFWYFTDLGNILQGVLIFVIFVWKQRVRHILVRKFCPQYADRSGSQFHSSIKSRPTTSHMSYSYTTTTSVSSHEQLQMKSTGTFRTSDVP
jgi:G protein-coupled receptor Mth (Methuselah protein)